MFLIVSTDEREYLRRLQASRNASNPTKISLIVLAVESVESPKDFTQTSKVSLHTMLQNALAGRNLHGAHSVMAFTRCPPDTNCTAAAAAVDTPLQAPRFVTALVVLRL